MTPEAASPAGTPPAPGQAASAQQSAPQQDPAPAQGGQPPAVVPAPGQQGEQPGSTQHPETPAAPVVPEHYELRLPEGTPLDQSDLDAVAALAKEQAWSNEQAQETVAEMHARVTAQSTAFRAELTADPELGGANLEQTQQMAMRVLDRFLPASDPQGARLRSLFNRTGYGNFVPLVKLLAGIGRAMSEDQPRPGGTGTLSAEPKRSQAERLFGDAQGIKPPS